MIRKIMEINKKRRAAKALFLYENMFFLPILLMIFSYSLCEVNNMTEEQELKKLQQEMEKKKQKIERKYSKIAKKRLQQLNEIIDPNQLIVDMDDNEFASLLQKTRDAFELYERDSKKTIDITDDDLPFNNADQSNRNVQGNGQQNYQGEQNYQ